MALALLKSGCKYSAEMHQKLYFAGKWGEKIRTLLQECRAAGMNKPCQYKMPYSLGKNELCSCRKGSRLGFLGCQCSLGDACCCDWLCMEWCCRKQGAPGAVTPRVCVQWGETALPSCRLDVKVLWFSLVQDEECQIWFLFYQSIHVSFSLYVNSGF